MESESDSFAARWRRGILTLFIQKEVKPKSVIRLRVEKKDKFSYNTLVSV